MSRTQAVHKGVQMDTTMPDVRNPYVMVLGIAEDGTYPSPLCQLACCAAYRGKAEHRRHCTSVVVVDPETNERWLVEATPDLRQQLLTLETAAGSRRNSALPVDGIIVTKPSVECYGGLMFLDDEILNTQELPVFAMPAMCETLMQNGPWEKLVRNDKIRLRRMHGDETVQLNHRLWVKPFIVDARGTEQAVGLEICGPQKVVVYMPPIGSWAALDEKERIENIMHRVDMAFVCGTVYSNDGSSQVEETSSVSVQKTISELSFRLCAEDCAKIHFIRFRHTNPLLHASSHESASVMAAGFKVAKEMDAYEL